MALNRITTNSITNGTAFNGTMGAVTPATGAFTSVTASTTLGVTGVSTLTAGAVVQGMTVGRGAGAIASNTVVGASALQNNTTGAQNTASGATALQNNTIGNDNTATGFGALQNNTTGNGNTALSPINSAGTYAPVFDPVTENNRFCMGSTGVTNAYIQVAWTVVSDARDKTDFAPVPHGLDFVTKLNPIAYRYKPSRESTDGHGPVRYGFKAQDVLLLEGDNPVIIDAEDSEKLRFNDQSMIAVLVKAIQELKSEFDLYKSTHP